MFNTDFVFTPGKLTICLDSSSGSSGKGKIGSHICQYANNWQFCCNTFAPQAGHWVVLNDGRKFFYQTLNSCAYQHEKYEKMYIAPGGIIELPAFFHEMEENNVPHHKIGISPITAILQDIDGAFEKGQVDFDGKPLTNRHDGTIKTGTTAHGAGACRARRVLRRKEAKYAKDIPELKQYLCNVPQEIMNRLDKGQAGLLEIAQGFQLSYLLQDFFPYTTSRNCTTMAGLDDLMIPPIYAGNNIINLRTYPIRINSKKYINKNGKHLTWAEIQEKTEGKDYETIDSYSGPGYPDSQEITWEQITKISGSPTPIMEITSVTKLPRRIFTFSKQNLTDAIRYNRGNGKTYLSLNFTNYIDHTIYKKSEQIQTINEKTLGPKIHNWIQENLTKEQQTMLKFIGTGPNTEHSINLQP
jgi:adenylosuccinate synthase